jgi:hypothetical protein
MPILYLDYNSLVWSVLCNPTQNKKIHECAILTHVRELGDALTLGETKLLIKPASLEHAS